VLALDGAAADRHEATLEPAREAGDRLARDVARPRHATLRAGDDRRDERVERR
jgi:hypothetical protein